MKTFKFNKNGSMHGRQFHMLYNRAAGIVRAMKDKDQARVDQLIGSLREVIEASSPDDETAARVDAHMCHVLDRMLERS